MQDLIFFSHLDCLLKDNGKSHPERSERLETIINSVNEIQNNLIIKKNAPIVNEKIIYSVHPDHYIKNMFSKIPSSGFVKLEDEPYADTFLCSKSKNAILRSCGSGIAAADELVNNSKKRVFCGVRPPGHHAEKIRANGFCFINNVAVCTRYLQNTFDVNKIAIIDFDVHHGNGTQEIFYSDESVFYGSIHQHPLFPGTGLETETGVGNIYNAPIKSGTKSKEFHEILENKILNKIDKFKPEIIIISAGFDAHYRDPLAQINLESEDFYLITKKIVDLSNIHSNGRVISFLEGGYDLIALHQSIKEHIKGLLEN
ncbi:histone deacetylase family protein [Alphaproteobacteria bacterium]|nr:histone deacetylase family protein [Alphaproteobacteria bacterium]